MQIFIYCGARFRDGRTKVRDGRTESRDGRTNAETTAPAATGGKGGSAFG
ncbi:MAG: hypothetical protein LBF90_02140 [Prevotellaceae bacterium]|jgi:hypothetical protein|nr:hypothetical protein [Prevotellaceae bacterium]